MKTISQAKPILLICTLLLFLSSCMMEKTDESENSETILNSYSTVAIGNIEHDEKSLFNNKGLKELWKKRIKNEGFETFEFASMEIKEKIDENTGEIYYILLGSNSDQTVKSAIFLAENNGILFIPDVQVDGQNKLLDLPPTTVTCSGCSYGCDPRKTIIDGKALYSCSYGCGQNCTKTVTTTFP